MPLSQQLFNEGKELETIEAERAAARQSRTQLVNRGVQRKDMVVENFPPPYQDNIYVDIGKTRDNVARTIGLGSGRQWDKLTQNKRTNPASVDELSHSSTEQNSSATEHVGGNARPSPYQFTM